MTGGLPGAIGQITQSRTGAISKRATEADEPGSNLGSRFTGPDEQFARPDGGCRGPIRLQIAPRILLEHRMKVRAPEPECAHARPAWRGRVGVHPRTRLVVHIER